MKLYIKQLIVVLICVGATVTSSAQDKKIESKEIKVTGVCKMCKKRIENAALIKGVKMAEWNKEANVLTVVYNTQKTSDTLICKSIANVGHDTELVLSDSVSYGTLPACCAYKDGVKTH